MTPKINFKRLVVQLLPWTKRMPVRVSMLRSMTSRLDSLFSEFDLWRDDVRMTVNVNSQVAVLEGYLRKKYRQPIAIKIVTYDDGALQVGLAEEGDTFLVAVPLEGEETAAMPPLEVPLEAEIRDRFGDADFIVYIPTGVDTDMIRADIERFKQALTIYKIVQQ